MRGPNKHYDCVAGPNGTQCRYCALRRFRYLNRYRVTHGLNPPTRPEVPPARRGGMGIAEPCKCKACQENRERVANYRHGKKPIKQELTDSELDRRALENWPAEWGMRA
jgi:hypothetical protein